MRKFTLQTKIILVLTAISLLTLLCINSGVGWWRYTQYLEAQNRNHSLQTKAFLSLIEKYEKELGFFEESVAQNKKYLKTSSCFVKYLSGKNSKRCAKKTLNISSIDLPALQLQNLFVEQITAEANNTFNYLTGKNKAIEIFDLHFDGKLLWRQNEDTVFGTDSNGFLMQQARKEKKSQFGIEQLENGSIYLSGIFSHFNPKEYYFSRVSINLENIVEELGLVNSAHMLIYQGRKIMLGIEGEMAGMMMKIDFKTDFEGNFAIQDWHYINRIEIPLSGSDRKEYFYLITDARQEIMRTIKGLAVIMMIFTVITIISNFLLVQFFRKEVIRHLLAAVEFAKRMADGDFTGKLPVTKEDEIGTLARSLNDMVTSVSAMLRELHKGAGTLSGSAANLSEISHDLFQMTSGTKERTLVVSDAVGNMEGSMEEVSLSSDANLQKMQGLATSIEGLSSTLNEIIDNTGTAQSITDSAVSQAKIASQNVNELGDAAKDIGKVTEAIKEISEQTNLLALNATIEAARAGEAGKGFAVVANEIKELAHLTAQSTTEITEKIEGIQQSANGTIDVIEVISDIINQASTIVKTIAVAVEEQSVVMTEANEDVSQTTDSIQEVNNSVSESAEVARSVSVNIAEVNSSIGRIDTLSGDVDTNSDELTQLAKHISAIMNRFTT